MLGIDYVFLDHIAYSVYKCFSIQETQEMPSLFTEHNDRPNGSSSALLYYRLDSLCVVAVHVEQGRV